MRVVQVADAVIIEEKLTHFFATVSTSYSLSQSLSLSLSLSLSYTFLSLSLSLYPSLPPSLVDLHKALKLNASCHRT